MNRPALWPIHNINGTNSTAPEVSAFLFNGYPVGLPVPSADHNGKLKRSGDWDRYLDVEGLRNDDWLESATGTVFALSSTSLTYDTGGNVLAAPGAQVSTRARYLIAGVRVETDETFLNLNTYTGGPVGGDPLIFPSATVPGRIWIYANEEGSPRYESVGPAVADSPAADEMTLVGLQIDGAGVVTDGAVAPITQPLPSQGMTVVIPVLVEDLSAETLSAERIIGTGNASFVPTIEAQPSAGAPSLLVTGNGSTSASQAAIDADGNTGRALRAESTGTVAAIDVVHTGSGDGVAIDTTGGSGDAISITAGAIGVNATSSTATAVQGITTSGTAVRGLSSGLGDAVVGSGGPNAASSGGLFVSTHVDAVALVGQTVAGASSSAAASRCEAFGDGTGVDARAADGYAITAESDTTSPTRAALRLVPQNNDPTTPLAGDLHFGSNRGTGKLRVYTTLHESVHSSDKGWVKQWGAPASGGPIAGGSGNLSLAQISPEETGDVLVTATGSLEWGGDTNNATVSLVDVTSAVTVASQIERAIDTDGVPPNQTSFSIRGERTLPDTSTRTFAVVISVNVGTVTYSNVVCSVEGVQ